MSIWGDTNDMEIDLVDRESQGDWDLEGTIDAPLALVIGSSNGAVIIEGTTEDLLQWAERVVTRLRRKKARQERYVAEHKDGRHTEHQDECPMCEEDGPTETCDEDEFFGPHSDAVAAALARDAERT